LIIDAGETVDAVRLPHRAGGGDDIGVGVDEKPRVGSRSGGLNGKGPPTFVIRSRHSMRFSMDLYLEGRCAGSPDLTQMHALILFSEEECYRKATKNVLQRNAATAPCLIRKQVLPSISRQIYC